MDIPSNNVLNCKIGKVDTSRIPLAHAAKEADVKRAKFAARKIRPYEVIRMINFIVAKLKLPRSMSRMNPTFNVDVLSPYVQISDKFLSRPIPKSSKLVIDKPFNQLQSVEKLVKNVSLIGSLDGSCSGTVKPNTEQLGNVNGTFATSMERARCRLQTPTTIVKAREDVRNAHDLANQ